MRRALICCAGLLGLLTMEADAGTAPRVGWQKVSLNYLFAQPNASAAPSIGTIAPIDILEDYESGSVAYAREQDVERLREAGPRFGIHVARHDEYDFLESGAGTIDTRLPITIPRLGRAEASYGPGHFGLYLLQFHAPLKPEWLTTITGIGCQLVHPLAVNGYLIGAKPEIALIVRQLHFTQWLEPHHPFLKAAPPPDNETATTLDVVVEFAKIPGSDAARQRALSLLAGPDRSEGYGPRGRYAVGRLNAAAIESLLQEPSVIGIYPVGESTTSDERQAMSLSRDRVETQSGNDVPVQPGTYASWLYDSTRCSVCNSLNLDNFKVSVADSGYYSGSESNLHPDIPNARLTYGGNFLPQGLTDRRNYFCSTNLAFRECSGPDVPCDVNYHGTFVANVLAGNGATGSGTGTTDSGGFVMGTGIVPSAGVVVTKIVNGDSAIVESSTSTPYLWAQDAVANGAYIQNHSNNKYIPQELDGNYHVFSQTFDKVVRGVDADGYSATPVTMIVSSGNVYVYNYKTRPAATAKNVIAVGAAESVRPSVEQRAGTWGNYATANSFRNIFRFSGHSSDVQSGTNPWEKYIKPDLVAPATQIAGAMSLHVVLPETPLAETHSCNTAAEMDATWGYENQTRIGYLIPGSNPQRYSRQYLIGSGTSFAAPVGAGAALIASRIYSSTPGAASPALLKAMLIATARSLRGGTYYPQGGSTQGTIGLAPNDVQGFGRIDITDIVTSSVAKSYFDQQHTFTASGQTPWARTYTVADRTKPVKIALVWTDVESIDYAYTATPSTLLVNDLDLEVYIGSTGSGSNCKAYYGNNIEVRRESYGEESIVYSGCNGIIDVKNNAEKVLFDPSASADNVEQFTAVVRGRKIEKRRTPCPDPPDPQNPPPCPDAPDQDFALYVQNATVLAQLPAPTLTSAVGGPSSATISWTAVQGAATYEISRADGTGTMNVIDSVSALTYTNASLPPGFYRYSVKAKNINNEAVSNSSNIEYAWVGSFTDDPLLVAETQVKATHMLELRDRVNELRVISGLSTFNFTHPVSVGATVEDVDVTELRAALNGARSAFGLAALTFENSITPGVTLIRAVDISEIRQGLR